MAHGRHATEDSTERYPQPSGVLHKLTRYVMPMGHRNAGTCVARCTVVQWTDWKTLYCLEEFRYLLHNTVHVHPDVLLGTHVREVIRRARRLMVHVTVAARHCCIRWSHLLAVMTRTGVGALRCVWCTPGTARRSVWI